MHRRATSSIRVDEGLVLRPASRKYTPEIVEAFEETWPDVIMAMPWINPDNEIRPQIEDFIADTERKGRSGLLHHWIMIRPWDGYVIGLIGFDRDEDDFDGDGEVDAFEEAFARVDSPSTDASPIPPAPSIPIPKLTATPIHEEKEPEAHVGVDCWTRWGAKL